MKYLSHLFCLVLVLGTFNSCAEPENRQQNPASVGNRTYQAPAPKPTAPPVVATQPSNTGFQAEPGQQTPLHFDHLAMKFGPVISGDTVHATYRFKNMTPGTVVIDKVATSCECLVAEYPQGNIQPGQIGEVKAQFRTEGQWGTHEKIISVILKGNSNPIPLRLNGEIRKMQ